MAQVIANLEPIPKDRDGAWTGREGGGTLGDGAKDIENERK